MVGFDTPKNLMLNEVINMLINNKNNLFDNNDIDKLMRFHVHLQLCLVQSYEWNNWCT